MECSKKHYLFISIILGILSVCLIIAISVIKSQEKSCANEDTCLNKDSLKADEDICLNKDCLEAASMILNSINDSVKPCDDFYEHSCGNWIASHKISPRGNSAGIFLKLRDILDERLRDLLEGDDDNQLESIKQAKTLFRSCNDINSIELSNVTKLIESVFNDTKWSMVRTLTMYSGTSLLPITFLPDFTNTSITKLYFSVGTSLLDKNQTNEKQFIKLVHGFKDLIDADAVIRIETDIANIIWNSTRKYDNITIEYFNNYIGLYFEDIVNDIMAAMDLPFTLTENNTMYIADIYYAKQLFDYINGVPDTELRNYAVFRLLYDLSIALPLRYRTVVEDFMNERKSVKYSLSRDIVCAKKVNSLMPLAIGRLYVDRFLKQSTREKVEKLVEEIRASMLEIFSHSDWMDEHTREAAKEKAAAVLDIIGYSTSVKMDKNFERASANFTETNFISNLVGQNLFNAKILFGSLFSATSRNMTSIPSAIVNAFYSPSKNSINFPAGILQKPFFDENYPNSLLFGVFGAVVGHEFTHGFDNQGSLYDKIGNLKNWWDKKTRKKFEERAEGLSQQYGEFNLCKGKANCPLKIDGIKTLGENIADNGGLKAAFNAYTMYTKTNKVKHQRLPGVKYTGDQLFFAGFAHIWCRKLTPTSIALQLKNEHSPARARVMVTLKNSVEFSKAFNCPLNSKMNPKKKYGVW